MTTFTTGQVEALLGIPASTLRFWEKEVPFLAPRKDVFGRRVYSATDLCVLSRLRFLAFKKGLGLKNACKALEDELLSADPSLRAEVMELKTSLFALAAESNTLRNALDSVPFAPESINRSMEDFQNE
jgi:DNA-binding transcriptional MerR regulator